MDKAEYKKLFSKYKVLDNKEYTAREEIMWERYVKQINIEANATYDIAKNQIIPAAVKYQASLASTIHVAEEVGAGSQRGAKSVLDELIGQLNGLVEGLDGLKKAHEAAEEEGSLPKKAESYKHHVLPAMLAVRKSVDTLEGIVADELWPLPKYREMLFQY
jgi:glutamine synthetase